VGGKPPGRRPARGRSDRWGGGGKGQGGGSSNGFICRQRDVGKKSVKDMRIIGNLLRKTKRNKGDRGKIDLRKKDGRRLFFGTNR